jgi:two-component system CheB/CheR fusion protein
MQASPDCLVLDVWLSGMTGVELLEHLAALGSTLPTVIITGRDDLQMRMRAMQAGAAAYFLKPLDGEDLLEALQEALQGRHLSG